MGLDVHMYVEVKRGWFWQHQGCQCGCLTSCSAAAEGGRRCAAPELGLATGSRRRLGQLACARDRADVAELTCRGFPEDASSSVAFAYEPWSDFETYPFWLTLEEIRKEDRLSVNGEHDAEWAALVSRLERYAGLFGGPYNVRVVYWFDW